LSTHPAVIVSIDVNVHSRMDWWKMWPRAVGICQWTLSSAPNHPIFIDAVRRVVNSTRVVEQWDINHDAEIQRLNDEQPDNWRSRIKQLQSQKKGHALSVMEWTGPGLFSDAVLA
jgi:alpha 1,6-mannosyltransferase